MGLPRDAPAAPKLPRLLLWVPLAHHHCVRPAPVVALIVEWWFRGTMIYSQETACKREQFNPW